MADEPLENGHPRQRGEDGLYDRWNVTTRWGNPTDDHAEHHEGDREYEDRCSCRHTHPGKLWVGRYFGRLAQAANQDEPDTHHPNDHR